MDLFDPLSPPDSIVHRPQKVFRVTSCISRELFYIGSSWSSKLCTSIWRGPQAFVPIPTAESGTSNLDSFTNGWLVSLQLLLSRVLPPWLVQYSSHHSCVIAVKLFLNTCIKRPCGASEQQYPNVYCLEKSAFYFILSVSYDFCMSDNLSIAVHEFASRVLMSFSGNETLLSTKANFSISFRGPPFSVEISLWLKHMYFVCLRWHGWLCPQLLGPVYVAGIRLRRLNLPELLSSAL